MNTKATFDATILNLTVAKAHTAYFKAVENGDVTRAHKIKDAVRLASKKLRECLDLVRHDIQRHVRASGTTPPGRGVMSEDALHKARTQEVNLVADLHRIKEISDDTGQPKEEPVRQLGAALRKAGLGVAG